MYKSSKKKNKYISFCDKMFIFTIYILIFCGGISYLKIGTGGVMITAEGGKPFLYEVFAVFFIIVFFIYLVYKKKLLINEKKKKILILMCLVHIPIFFIHGLFSEDIKYAYFGQGQLRLILILNILSLIACFYPINVTIVKHTILAIIIIGTINSVYAILAHLGFVEILYHFSGRIDGFSRHSGLLSVPASLGVLGSLNAVLGCWLYRDKKIKSAIVIIIINSIGIFLSISYTSIVTVFIGLLILFFKKIKENKIYVLIIFVITLVFMILVIPNIDQIIFQNMKRIESIGGAIKLWFDSYTLGIPWGEMNKYSGGLDMIFPHNWLLVSLIHGGTISFISLFTMYIYYFKKNFNLSFFKKNKTLGYSEIINLIIFMLLIAALFEQIFLLVPSVFILYLFIGFSTQTIKE